MDTKSVKKPWKSCCVIIRIACGSSREQPRFIASLKPPALFHPSVFPLSSLSLWKFISPDRVLYLGISTPHRILHSRTLLLHQQLPGWPPIPLIQPSAQIPQVGLVNNGVLLLFPANSRLANRSGPASNPCTACKPRRQSKKDTPRPVVGGMERLNTSAL